MIADIANIFTKKGHIVEDVCLSGHAEIMGKKRGDIQYLNADRWSGFIADGKSSVFYEEYKDKLSDVDAFIVCYPPAFVRLYEKFNKPVIMDIPIRFDYCMAGDENTFNDYVRFIRDGVDCGKIILVANSKYDKLYTENFVDREVAHIPSLCKYTGNNYNYDNAEFRQALYTCHYNENNMPIDKDRCINKNMILHFGYKWSELLKFSGMVHFPYNISTMSIFEHYTANIPLFFPSKKFILEHYKSSIDFIDYITENHRNGIQFDYKGRYVWLDQVSWNFVFNQQNKSIAKGRSDIDLNDYKSLDTVKTWLDNADFFDEEWMPHITYFDSFDDLNSVLDNCNFKDVSNKMYLKNIWREREILKRWDTVINKVKDYNEKFTSSRS